MIAKALPHLIESKLILMHRDHLPERILQKRIHHQEDTIHQIKKQQRSGNCIIVQYQILIHVISLMLINIALRFGSLPEVYQNVLAHIVPSAFIVAVMYVSYYIIENYYLFILLISFTSLLIALIYLVNNNINSTNNRNRISKDVRKRKVGIANDDDENNNRKALGLDLSSDEEDSDDEENSVSIVGDYDDDDKICQRNEGTLQLQLDNQLQTIGRKVYTLTIHLAKIAFVLSIWVSLV